MSLSPSANNWDTPLPLVARKPFIGEGVDNRDWDSLSLSAENWDTGIVPGRVDISLRWTVLNVQARRRGRGATFHPVDSRTDCYVTRCLAECT